MLRIEQGFDESVFESHDRNLVGYTVLHRRLVPALAAYDLSEDDTSPEKVRQQLDAVLDGQLRAATLAFARSGLISAGKHQGWLTVKDRVQGDILPSSPWRVERGISDENAQFKGAKAWTATRNVVKLPAGAPDDRSTRVRERYTFTSVGDVGSNDIRGILIDNDAPEDVMLATATVYAINKTVPKPSHANAPVDLSLFPNIAALRRN